MKWIDGNLLVTTAIVLGGLGCAASASCSVLLKVLPGSGPSDHAGKWPSYLARFGMPNVWWISILL